MTMQLFRYFWIHHNMLITSFCCPAVCVASSDFSQVLNSLCRSQTLNQAQFLCSSRSLTKPAMNKVHEILKGDKRVAEAPSCSSWLQKPSESYWRDIWHRLNSALFPGHCCCCACASYRSSDTACTLSPVVDQKNRRRSPRSTTISSSARIAGKEKRFFWWNTEVKSLW